VVDPERVLTEAGCAVLARLPQVGLGPDVYLAGGTGLALHLGHRVSVDFDFFSAHNGLSLVDRADLVRRCRAVDPDMVVVLDQDGTLGVRLGGVDVSFYRYDVALLEPLVAFAGLAVASVPDIAAMKLAAVVGRGGKKDFVDIHRLLRERPLSVWLDGAVRKFVGVRDFRTAALRALVYFDDAEAEPLPRMVEKVDWQRLKAELRLAVAEVARADYGLG